MIIDLKKTPTDDNLVPLLQKIGYPYPDLSNLEDLAMVFPNG